MLALSKKASDFKPGDVVSWRLPGNLPHIGIVSDRKARDGTPLIIHNVGAGAKRRRCSVPLSDERTFPFCPRRSCARLKHFTRYSHSA